MPTFREHVEGRLRPLFNNANFPASIGPRTKRDIPSSVIRAAGVAIGKSRMFWQYRLDGQQPIRLPDVTALLGHLGMSAGAMLDGRTETFLFHHLITIRLIALMDLHGVAVQDVERLIDCSPRYILTHLRPTSYGLTLEDVDLVLGAIGAPVPSLFAPVVGPGGARLLRVLSRTTLHPVAARRVLAVWRNNRAPLEPGDIALLTALAGLDRQITTKEAIRLYANGRGEKEPSRPTMTRLSGAGAAIESLQAEGLITCDPGVKITEAGLSTLGADNPSFLRVSGAKEAIGHLAAQGLIHLTDGVYHLAQPGRDLLPTLT